MSKVLQGNVIVTGLNNELVYLYEGDVVPDQFKDDITNPDLVSFTDSEDDKPSAKPSRGRPPKGSK